MFPATDPIGQFECSCLVCFLPDLSRRFDQLERVERIAINLNDDRTKSREISRKRVNEKLFANCEDFPVLWDQ
jgi:hypothetical protein